MNHQCGPPPMLLLALDTWLGRWPVRPLRSTRSSSIFKRKATRLSAGDAAEEQRQRDCLRLAFRIGSRLNASKDEADPTALKPRAIGVGQRGEIDAFEQHAARGRRVDRAQHVHERAFRPTPTA